MTLAADEARAARRERQFHSARDFETSSSQIGDVDPIGEELKAKMQRIIAANAKGRSKRAQVADATLLMQMLGVHPNDTFDPAGPVTNPPAHPTSTR